jgi:hypothetical protein
MLIVDLTTDEARSLRWVREQIADHQQCHPLALSTIDKLVAKADEAVRPKPMTDTGMSEWLLKTMGPDIFPTWQRDVGLPDDQFVFGVCGAKNPKKGQVPLQCKATCADWYINPGERHQFRYDPIARKWTRTVPPPDEGV